MHTRRQAGLAQGIIIVAIGLLPMMAIVALMPIVPLLVKEFSHMPNIRTWAPQVLSAPGLCVALLATPARRVLLNLLDNSHRFNAHHVTITALQEGADTVLRVQDDGDGCQPHTKARLQQSLQQQAYGEGSAMRGLGLVLADLVARAHGGHTVLPDCASGFGIDLRWPAAPPRSAG